VNQTIGHILYDDTCGFCRGWVPKWSGMLKKRGIGTMPLQSPVVRQWQDLPMAELMTDIFLILEDGRAIRGANVYRYVMRRVWWLLPVYVLSVIPGLRWIFDRAYRTFADNRHRISKACRLPGADEGTHGA